MSQCLCACACACVKTVRVHSNAIDQLPDPIDQTTFVRGRVNIHCDEGLTRARLCARALCLRVAQRVDGDWTRTLVQTPVRRAPSTAMCRLLLSFSLRYRPSSTVCVCVCRSRLRSPLHLPLPSSSPHFPPPRLLFYTRVVHPGYCSASPGRVW